MKQLRSPFSRNAFIAGSVAVSVCLIACNANQPAEDGLTPKVARQIAKDAFIYGFPIAANYNVRHYGWRGRILVKETGLPLE